MLAKNLRNGGSTCCGCIPKYNPSFQDLTGQIFNKWNVIKLESNRDGTIYYWCRCECGTEKSVRGTHLKCGESKSCGCSFKLTNPNDAKLASVRNVYNKTYSDGNLSFEEFLILSQQNCYYCGEEPNNNCNVHLFEGKTSSQFAKDNGDFIYNGLDRIDSNLLHDKNNLVPCCHLCNLWKRNMIVNDFLGHITKIFNHSKLINIEI